ncbi:SDR family oxidoreductase [Longimicrobium sp.]|uniref:SDR family NAD(P)-dependent oxidoreductase n=1 Tax=Longimicrobium sp. TaxID=2029185 RepID=UPI002BAF95D2|nr:SDR family oxidoreductase [Longimicrobium sp.]HSU15118.1 SDR family oxidoreductase [Longimicrobium sp.]
MARDAWEYRGRWALVTGASSGIGKAFARELARRGMHVALAARREDRLRALADELASAHRIRTLVLPADLGEPGAAGELWRQAAEGRDIHLLVNNAGFGLKGAFHELPLERQSEMVRVNCIAPMELAHHALNRMRGRGGGIVNVASVAGAQPIPLIATYAASKAFLISLSEALAIESREAGVRVVTVNPGPVKTGFQAVAGTEVRDRAPGIRTPEQIVDAALHALETGRMTVTPGLVNRLAVAAVRVAPRGLAIRAAKAVMRRLR